MNPKPVVRRIEDPDIRMKTLRRDKFCCLYGKVTKRSWECKGHVDQHHIKTKGSGGDDVLDNSISLCRFHHTHAHNGIIAAIDLYKILEKLYKYTYLKLEDKWLITTSNTSNPAPVGSATTT